MKIKWTRSTALGGLRVAHQGTVGATVVANVANHHLESGGVAWDLQLMAPGGFSGRFKTLKEAKAEAERRTIEP